MAAFVAHISSISFYYQSKITKKTLNLGEIHSFFNLYFIRMHKSYYEDQVGVINQVCFLATKFHTNNIQSNITIKQEMKHFRIDDIINRRRQIKQTPLNSSFEQKKGSKNLNEQNRDINDQTIDALVQIALKKQQLSHENRLNIIRIIANKTGVNLNKNIVAPLIQLVSYPQVLEISNGCDDSNYFILKGRLQIYQARNQDKLEANINTEQIKAKNASNTNTQISIDKTQQDLLRFLKFNKAYHLAHQYSEFRSIGPLFNPHILSSAGDIKQKQSKKQLKLVAIEAVVVQIKKIDSSPQTLYNDGITLEDKTDVLTHFSALRLLGKKLANFISSFKVKNLYLKQLIYRQGDQPKAVYFIIEGQIGFQYLMEQDLKSTLQESQKHYMTVNTQTISHRSYFGEEEILSKIARVQTAKCISSKCVVLELQKDKFEKMLDNTQFADLMTKEAKIKRIQRQKALEKASKILKASIKKTAEQSFQGVTEQQLKFYTMTQKKKDSCAKNEDKKFSVRRKSQNHVKIMHGHVIRQFKDNSEEVHFSMRDVYPDMYEAAEKFRKLIIKPAKSIGPPEHPWNFKRVWKILNLEDVLREEEMEIASPQGRKFFDCHRRLKNQVNETKSLRPKTSSSNYRTKLQYIAYLQQFNV